MIESNLPSHCIQREGQHKAWHSSIPTSTHGGCPVSHGHANRATALLIRLAAAAAARVLITSQKPNARIALFFAALRPQLGIARQQAIVIGARPAEASVKMQSTIRGAYNRRREHYAQIFIKKAIQ